MADLKQTLTVESYYVKKSDGIVYFYWRLAGSNTWNVQKTAMKDVPYIETDLSSIQLGRWESK